MDSHEQVTTSAALMRTKRGLEGGITDSVYLPSTTDGVAHVGMPRQINRVELNHRAVPARAGYLWFEPMGDWIVPALYFRPLCRGGCSGHARAFTVWCVSAVPVECLAW
jgi:hypothetical protein